MLLTFATVQAAIAKFMANLPPDYEERAMVVTRPPEPSKIPDPDQVSTITLIEKELISLSQEDASKVLMDALRETEIVARKGQAMLSLHNLQSKSTDSLGEHKEKLNLDLLYQEAKEITLGKLCFDDTISKDAVFSAIADIIQIHSIGSEEVDFLAAKLLATFQEAGVVGEAATPTQQETTDKKSALMYLKRWQKALLLADKNVARINEKIAPLQEDS